ncbi:hypothetical protein BJ166DRAFT_538923 [Pestalotiopsis sp. NC0098]|nr:hypothetical protein BJ166DRAFT_538923 [Pestalotiopsis sp. NC0098]
MKTTFFLAAMGASLAVASSSVSTTVVCSSCPNVTSTADDIVTRSAIPTTPCSAPALTIVSSAMSSATAGMNATATAVGTGSGSGSGSGAGSGSGSSSTMTPVTAGAEKFAFSGAVALAAAVVYLV